MKLLTDQILTLINTLGGGGCLLKPPGTKIAISAPLMVGQSKMQTKLRSDIFQVQALFIQNSQTTVVVHGTELHLSCDLTSSFTFIYRQRTKNQLTTCIMY